MLKSVIITPESMVKDEAAIADANVADPADAAVADADAAVVDAVADADADAVPDVDADADADAEEKEEDKKEEEEEGKKEEEEEGKEGKGKKGKKGEKGKHEKGKKGEKGNEVEDLRKLLNEDIPWKIIDKMFKDNPNMLVYHQLESYNDFMLNGIRKIFKERNPIVFKKVKELDEHKNPISYNTCKLYFGGKKGDGIYFNKPTCTNVDNTQTYLYPNIARLKNMTYGVTITYDVEVWQQDEDDDFEDPAAAAAPAESAAVEADADADAEAEKPIIIKNVLLGSFPIMVNSNLCILHDLVDDVKYHLGEDKSDRGGYFIIDGKEKVIISQEAFSDNALYIRERGVDDEYSHSAEIRTVSEDSSKPERKLRVFIVAPSPTYTNNQIVVDMPNVKTPIPLFIIMRALGVISDYDIIETCILNMAMNSELIEHFRSSVHDASQVFTQRAAMEYISVFVKGKSIKQVNNILMNYFLPQIGELNFQHKALFLGYMVFRLLRVKCKIDAAIDRDSYKFKRVLTPGLLLYRLFKEYYAQQLDYVKTQMDKRYNENVIEYREDIKLLFSTTDDLFKERIVEKGIYRGFKGNWGGSEFTRADGIVQDLSRLSFNSALSLIRKINLPLDESSSAVKPRLLHGSQWGLIDPVDIDDGLQKHYSLSTHVTRGCSGNDMITWILNEPIIKIFKLDEHPNAFLYEHTKLFVNGTWIGVVPDPTTVSTHIRSCRRLSLIPIHVSCAWDIQHKEIQIFTDTGRLMRPVFYYEPLHKQYAFQTKSKMSAIIKNTFTWNDITCGFGIKERNDNDYIKSSDVAKIVTIYGGSVTEAEASSMSKLYARAAVLEYLDVSEEDQSLVAVRPHNDEKTRLQYTHADIHPSLMFGIMGNLISFPENNQLPRNAFSCSQSRQAVSLYHTNFLSRMDKMGVVLNSGQIPIVKTRYLSYYNEEQNPYGENAIVAIMCNNGYNVEDSILFNEGSIRRGLFRTTYYSTYDTYEESKSVGGKRIESRVANLEEYLKNNQIKNKKGFDYSFLDDRGVIKELSPITQDTILVGKLTTTNLTEQMKDESIRPKKGQTGYVDKVFMTENKDETNPDRIVKIRIREDRAPSIGDKFASRCGQKGTVGLIIPEQDMPFTASGLRPDLIVNPHAFPSRMTIGQFVETIIAKTCVVYGAFGDCTAFVNIGNKQQRFGEMLQEEKYHSAGSEILYNGLTGEQIDSNIFIGPTYYMRLKHMVKDKINFRARGPNTNLTRQPVQGRANDGGLRIGEMERDGIIGHGAAHFLQESMLVRGDNYYLAICNVTGMTAIYNPNQNVFISPMADGPLQFTGLKENNPKLIHITRYGRSFSIVQIPYSFKLLIQELQTMNVQMRIITEDNIDQIQNMSYSNNYKLLLQNGKTTILPAASASAAADAADDAVFQDTVTIDENEKVDADMSGGDKTVVEMHVDREHIDVYQKPLDHNHHEDHNHHDYHHDYKDPNSNEVANEWSEYLDPQTNKAYYVNNISKHTMWYKPNPHLDSLERPPKGWYIVFIDDNKYYHNIKHNITKSKVTQEDADADTDADADDGKREPTVFDVEIVCEEDAASKENDNSDKKIFKL